MVFLEKWSRGCLPLLPLNPPPLAVDKAFFRILFLRVNFFYTFCKLPFILAETFGLRVTDLKNQGLICSPSLYIPKKIILITFTVFFDAPSTKFMMGCDSEPLWGFESWADSTGCGKEEIDGPLWVMSMANGFALLVWIICRYMLRCTIFFTQNRHNSHSFLSLSPSPPPPKIK